MAEPHVITALVKKRAALAGALKQLDKQRRSIRDKIVHVDNALKLFGYEGNPRHIPPRCQYTRLFKRGELRRMVIDILRTANAPMLNKEIAAQIVQKQGWSGEDAELLERITGSVKPARRAIERRG